MEKKQGKNGKKAGKPKPGMRQGIIRNAVFVFAAALLFSAVVFYCYVSDYYKADRAAAEALKTDEVSVEKTDYGWYFDGPSEDTALVFYPGGKVEETAYAPLLHSLAAGGVDVCLAKMPFRLAVLDRDAARDMIEMYSYEKWYIGGHSLGGVMAADFAAGNSDLFEGVILLAAYPVKELPCRGPGRALPGNLLRCRGRGHRAVCSTCIPLCQDRTAGKSDNCFSASFRRCVNRDRKPEI